MFFVFVFFNRLQHCAATQASTTVDKVFDSNRFLFILHFLHNAINFLEKLINKIQKYNKNKLFFCSQLY